MAKVKTVGVREFRDHATTYLSGAEPVAVSKHGQAIGFYLPVERDQDQVQRALDRLAATVGKGAGEDWSDRRPPGRAARPAARP